MTKMTLDTSILEEDFEGWGNEKYEVFNVFRDYLGLEQRAEVTSLLDRLVDFYVEGYTERRIINDMFISVAEHTPYSSPVHRKLARMVQDFEGNEKRKERSKTFLRPEDDEFRGQLLEDIADIRVCPLGAVQSGLDPIECANFDAFLANLMQVGFAYDLSRLLRYAMQDAFYQDHAPDLALEPSKAQEMLDAWVLTAAQWIHHNSKGAHEIARRGDDKLQMADWIEWRQEFQKAANDQKYGEECRKVASQAADLMALAEKLVVRKSDIYCEPFVPLT
ncbi:hypothetical protein B9Z65_6428 [Elsinoe australis]|uniref:Uncharacterized protein n=1 Tax=Elsinoe australis TaxID=40998 RepID=A0A2P8A8M1_9PEZI|nr:hypothetical protein B9Z65_6428 [Elsinoe australis]